MKSPRTLFAFALLFATSSMFGKISGTVQTPCSDFEYILSGNFRPESFYGKNISLLNNNNCDLDKVLYSRHTLDVNLGVLYGKETFGFPVSEMKLSIRNRGVWGNPGSISRTTSATTKVVDSVGRSHSHSIPRHIFWMREGWLKFDIGEFLGLDFGNKHNFTIGAFPFEVGRGISLGSAYAVGPELLGFYSDSIVDQYAFGAKFAGDILADCLHYDLYASILQNKSGSLSDTGAHIFGQQYGRIADPARGFGKINFIVATRLDWTAFDNDSGRLNLENYALFNSDPEQSVEFLGDASSKMGTLGFAGNYVGDWVEVGFDTAVNFGRQKVKGWDRNQVQEKNIDARVSVVNSHVVSDPDGAAIPFVGNSTAQNIIDSTFEDETQNNQIIGTVAGDIGFLAGPITLKNKNNRFRDSYSNSFHGWMFVSDLAFWLRDHTVRWAIEAGAASGDDNPNVDTMDRRYDGFVGLQELYSGNKVRSAFVLGGAGRLPRLLSTPESDQSSSRYSSAISGFTNLVYAGTSFLWKPKWEREFVLQPNVISYWQGKGIKKFDAEQKMDIDCPASKHLGVETNVFMHFYPFCDMKLYCVGSVFFPGNHYTDIKGKPINAAQQAELDLLDVTGFDADRIPNIGDDTAWTINLGIEFKF